MSWSAIVKSNDNISIENIKIEPKIIKKKIVFDEYRELYDLCFNEDINDLYLYLKNKTSDRCLNILNNTNRNTYNNFFKLIYDNTIMIEKQDSDSDMDLDMEDE